MKPVIVLTGKAQTVFKQIKLTAKQRGSTTLGEMAK
tara:strand:- start:1557 stop:1664 length:108 start_codon:yes stop_codon:yes gene_type:complete